MKALITGASSGMGTDMARILDSMGYDTIIVARRKEKLESLKNELKNDTQIICMDISSTFNCMKLYNKVKKENIDVLINNAGFGLFGEFSDTSLDKELDMIDLNIKTVHTLTKLFLHDFKERNYGYILNVASMASFMPGPCMATYYATKAYVSRLTEAISYELKKEKSNVFVGTLYPGPVNTEFNSVAKVKFRLKAMESYDVASYAIKKMFKKKETIVPNLSLKIMIIILKIIPEKLKMFISYHIQKNN